MIDLREIQKRIIAYRRAKGFPSADRLDKTSLGLLEEAGEFEKARRHENREEMIDALGDIIVFCLGGLSILGTDAEKLLEEIVSVNEDRKHPPH